MKNPNLEMKIYEKIGVKQFRKFVFFTVNNACLIFMGKFFKSKEEKQEIIQELNKQPSNYNIGSKINKKTINNFKKQIYLNSAIHISAFLLLLPSYFLILVGNLPLDLVILTGIFTVINTYCLILQRYNSIRIDKTLEKLKQHEERKQEKLKEKQKENIKTYEYQKNKEKVELKQMREILLNSQTEDRIIYEKPKVKALTK